MVAALQTTEAAQTIGEAEGWLPLSARQLEQQWADETLVLVRDWLEAWQLPSWPEVSARGPEVKAYHSLWGCFQLHDGVVHRRLRLPQAYVVPDQSTATTAKRLVEMFARFRVPAELHSDQAEEGL
ncbi:unnamed protein product [Arctogadus glacialis]